MKLVTFAENGAAKVGVVAGDEIRVVSDTAWGAGKSMRQLIERGELLKAASHTSTVIPLASVQLLPPVIDPPRIWCIGVNYDEHRKEVGRDPTLQPTIFTRTPQSQVGHAAPIAVPKASTDLDYEAEIAIVIGKGGRDITQDQALSHIAGYSCYNDATIRDWQRHTTQWIPGKNFDGIGSFGPWLVTPDEMPPLESMRVQARLNGKVMQEATAGQMLFTIPEIIAYISSFSALLPGDVIATGTPGGVGAKRNPPVWMQPGDTIEIEVTGVGVLSNPIV